MNIIQDKLGNEFLRSSGGGGGVGGVGGVMDSNFGSGMIMFSHLPPVTSFTRLAAAHSVMQDLPPPQEMMILKKERDSPDCSLDALGGGGGCSGGVGLGGGILGGGLGCVGVGVGDYVHAMGIKQEKLSEHDYRLPLYPGGGGGGGGQGKSTELLEVTVSNNHSLMGHDLHMGSLPSQLGKEPSGRKGRRSNGDGQEGKPRKKRSEAKSLLLDAEGGSLSPGNKPHICEHCSASFRSSYHLRRHVLIHTGERPFRCSQCNMSFIQKYLLQRHEKIHSGEKPFSCDQCNMRFIQKYHMERHKRTHSGEKPYRCETCQQYFSRTDRLLKHKRTCGDAMKKGLDGGMIDLGCVDMMGHGSYGITQGNTGSGGRKRGKSKNCGEGGERRKKKAAAVADGGGRVPPPLQQPPPHIHDSVPGGYGIHEYSMENQTTVSSSSSGNGPGPSMHQGRAPKMAFKKANRKAAMAKEQQQQQAAAAGGLDGLGLMQGNGPKVGVVTSSNSSNYDDAMQFLKKRRYLNAANNAMPPPPPPQGPVVTGSNEYDVGVVHLSSQPSVIQGVVSGGGGGVMDLDKSGIPDEVLQSLLDHYAQKPDGSHHHHHDDDVHFDIGADHSQHVELTTVSADGGVSPPGDKTVMMHEYSRFLLQALERTSHSGVFPFSGGGGGASSHAADSSNGSSSPLYADKNIYTTTSPLDCGGGGGGGFGQAASPSLPSSVPKSHFAMLTGSSPQHAFHLETPPPHQQQHHHQQLTPSQELTEQHSSSSSSSSSSSYHHHHHTEKEQPPPPLSAPLPLKNGTTALVYALAPSQDLGPLDAAAAASSKPSPYQIENFAQAFGFKSDGRGLSSSYGGATDSNGVGGVGVGEVDHRIRTPVSEFSGFSSLLSDVNEPVSTGSKTPTSQSYR